MTGTRSCFVLLVTLSGMVINPVPAQVSPAVGGPSTAQRIEDQSEHQDQSSGNLRRRAEDLAGAASKRFSEILSEQNGDAQADGAGANADGKSTQRADDLMLTPVWDWLASASRDYENIIVAKLRTSSGVVEIVTPPRQALAQAEVPPTPPVQSAPAAEPGWGSIIDNIREWLARANRSYHNEIVKKLARPWDAEDSWKAVVEAEGEDGLRPAAKAGTAPAQAEGAIDRGAATLPAGEQRAAPKVPVPAPDLAEAKEETGAADDVPGLTPKLDAEEIKRLAEKAVAEREAESNTKTEHLAEEPDFKRRAAIGAERKRITDEAQAKRLAEEAEAARKAAIESERIRITDEAQAKRLAAEAEAARKAAKEAEAARQAAKDAEAKQAAEEDDAKQLAEMAEAKREAVQEEEAKRLADETQDKRPAEEVQAKRQAEIEAERKRLTDEAQAKRLATEAEAERRAAKEAEDKRLADEAEPKRKAEKERATIGLAEDTKVAVEHSGAQEVKEEVGEEPQAQPADVPPVGETGTQPQSVARQARSDAQKTEPPPVPVAKEPVSRPPSNDRLPTVDANKGAATPSRTKAKKKQVRIRKASRRKRRVSKGRYRRRAARSGTRVYAYKSRRKQTRTYRHRKDCWRRGAKQVAPRKAYRKRARVHGYRKRHRARVHGRSGVYVVRRGDTLWGIAKRHYGKGAKYRRIYKANRRKIRNPNRIYPRQHLYIPARRR